MNRKQIVPVIVGVFVALVSAAGFTAAAARPGPSQQEVEAALQAQLDARLTVLLAQLRRG